MARQKGLEPLTHGLEGRCSVHLSYWRVLSGRADLNGRPPAPKAGALPGCATPRTLKRYHSENRLSRINSELRRDARNYGERQITAAVVNSLQVHRDSCTGATMMQIDDRRSHRANQAVCSKRFDFRGLRRTGHRKSRSSANRQRPFANGFPQARTLLGIFVRCISSPETISACPQAKAGLSHRWLPTRGPHMVARPFFMPCTGQPTDSQILPEGLAATRRRFSARLRFR